MEKAVAEQPYKLFAAEDLEISFPDWLILGEKYLAEPKVTRVAVTSDYCSFVITARSLPPNIDFKKMADEFFKSQLNLVSGKIIKETAGEKDILMEAEFKAANLDMYSVSFGLLMSKNQFYAAAFLGVKDKFNYACLPFIKKTIDSIKVK